MVQCVWVLRAIYIVLGTGTYDVCDAHIHPLPAKTIMHLELVRFQFMLHTLAPYQSIYRADKHAFYLSAC